MHKKYIIILIPHIGIIENVYNEGVNIIIKENIETFDLH